MSYLLLDSLQKYELDIQNKIYLHFNVRPFLPLQSSKLASTWPRLKDGSSLQKCVSGCRSAKSGLNFLRGNCPSDAFWTGPLGPPAHLPACPPEIFDPSCICSIACCFMDTFLHFLIPCFTN